MNAINHNTEELYKSLSSRLRQFIKKRVPDREAADDILQEVFLKIHSRIDTLRDRNKIESWIFQITRNVIADHHRNQRIAIEPAENLATVEDDEDMTQKLAPCLVEMIESLPEESRQALKLTEYEGMAQKGLARKLGISVSGAKSRVQRARALLRDRLMECCHFEFDRNGAIIDYHPISCSCCTPQESAT